MNLIWGIILIVFTFLCWLGQTLSLLTPQKAAKLGLCEHESEVDPVFWADVRGEAAWDTLILWTLPAAGILLLINHPLWAYFGLVGGGMYFYFAGRGIFTRLALRHRNIRIGTPGQQKIFFLFLGLWGLIALITIMMAATKLSQRGGS